MSNRRKHLSDNFETRQVFNVVGENLSIEQHFDDVNVDDDVNMEIALPETNLNIQFTIERNSLDFIEHEANAGTAGEIQDVVNMDNEIWKLRM